MPWVCVVAVVVAIVVVVVVVVVAIVVVIAVVVVEIFVRLSVLLLLLWLYGCRGYMFVVVICLSWLTGVDLYRAQMTYGDPLLVERSSPTTTCAIRCAQP
jgi:hypothetical protein